jgi:hypothetical protein
MQMNGVLCASYFLPTSTGISFCHTTVGMTFKFEAESSNFLLKLEDLEFLKHRFFIFLELFLISLLHKL